MEKFKKLLSMLLVVALTAAVVFTGTMAYLTQDAGSKNNVFTVGNIDVSLDEEVGIIGEGGTVTETTDGADYSAIMPGDYLKKKVTVSNDGKTDAYVAITVTMNNADKINAAIDDVYEGKGYSEEEVQEMYNFIFDGWGINYNPRPGKFGSDARGVIDGTYGLPEHVLHVDYAKTTKGSTLIGTGNWFVEGREKAGQYWVDGPGEYDGYYTKNMNDYEICYTYYAFLPAGESTTIFNGLNVPAEFTNDQMKMFDGLDIKVNAKAIQADNMGVADVYKDDVNGKAKTAFAVLHGDIDADSLGVNNTDSPVGYQVNNATEFATAVANGETVIWLNPGSYNLYGADNKTLTVNGTKDAIITIANEGEDGCDYAFDNSTVTFKGVTIDTRGQSGNYRGFARLAATFNDCNFVGPYTSHRVQTFNNCTFDFNNGYFWIWGADKVTFNECTFNGNSKNILAHGWASSVININNCNFAATEKGYASNGTVWTSAVEIDPAGTNTYTISFTGENTLNENYSGWYRIKDGSTGHTITGLN